MAVRSILTPINKPHAHFNYDSSKESKYKTDIKEIFAKAEEETKRAEAALKSWQ